MKAYSGIFSELDESLGSFEREDGSLSPYDNEGSLEEAIDDFLANHPRVIDYDVEATTMFNSPGYECGYVSFAYIAEGGEFNHGFYEWCVD